MGSSVVVAAAPHPRRRGADGAAAFVAARAHAGGVPGAVQEVGVVVGQLGAVQVVDGYAGATEVGVVEGGHRLGAAHRPEAEAVVPDGEVSVEGPALSHVVVVAQVGGRGGGRRRAEEHQAERAAGGHARGLQCPVRRHFDYVVIVHDGHRQGAAGGRSAVERRGVEDAVRGGYEQYHKLVSFRRRVGAGRDCRNAMGGLSVGEGLLFRRGVVVVVGPGGGAVGALGGRVCVGFGVAQRDSDVGAGIAGEGDAKGARFFGHRQRGGDGDAVSGLGGDVLGFCGEEVKGREGQQPDEGEAQS